MQYKSIIQRRKDLPDLMTLQTGMVEEVNKGLKLFAHTYPVISPFLQQRM